MANEFVHATVGTTMTQVEFEAVGLHVLNSQATGDLIYASSGSQLSRLAIGAADTVLTCNGTIPAWSATPILNTAVAKGTWTASGTWTIPAVTLGGNLNAAGYSLSLLGVLSGQNTTTALQIFSHNSLGDYTNSVKILTQNAAHNAWVARLSISDHINTAVATWASVTHTGIVLSGNLKYNAESTGAGATATGSNCPAITATSVHTWLTVTAPDGDTIYIPAWK